MVFDTIQSQIVLGLAIPVVILTQRDNFSILGLMSQLIVYLAIAYNSDCLIKGNCDSWSWLSVVFPILYSVMYIMFWDRLVIMPRFPLQPGVQIGARPGQQSVGAAVVAGIPPASITQPQTPTPPQTQTQPQPQGSQWVMNQ